MTTRADHPSKVVESGGLFFAVCACGWAQKNSSRTIHRHKAERAAEQHVATGAEWNEPEPTGPTCTKVAYRSEAKAKRVLLNAQIRRVLKGSRQRREVRAYRCHICRSWHLTSKPLRVNA